MYIQSTLLDVSIQYTYTKESILLYVYIHIIVYNLYYVSYYM